MFSAMYLNQSHKRKLKDMVGARNKVRISNKFNFIFFRTIYDT